MVRYANRNLQIYTHCFQNLTTKSYVSFKSYILLQTLAVQTLSSVDSSRQQQAVHCIWTIFLHTVQSHDL